MFNIIPKDKGIYIEIKDDRKIFVEKLREIINQSEIQKEKIRIIAFNPNTVRQAKDVLPEIKTYWLFGWYFSKKKCLKSLAQRRLIQTLKTLNCDGIDVNAAPYIDEKLVKSLRENNLDFCAYDVDKVEDAIRLINLGIDSITTNSPLRIREEINTVIARNIV